MKPNKILYPTSYFSPSKNSNLVLISIWTIKADVHLIRLSEDIWGFNIIQPYIGNLGIYEFFILLS